MEPFASNSSIFDKTLILCYQVFITGGKTDKDYYRYYIIILISDQ